MNLRYLFVIAFVILISLVGLFSAEATTFAPTYEDAVARAGISGYPLMIVFYSDACVYCKKLESEVIQEPEVSKVLEQFVCVRVNIKDRPDVAQIYRVRGVPMVIFTKLNSRLSSIMGYRPKEDFLAVVNQYLKLIKDNPNE